MSNVSMHTQGNSLPRKDMPKDVISEKKYIRKLKKLCDDPEARHISLSPEGNLILKGKHDMIVEHYALVSPRGIFAKANGSTWQPNGQSKILPVEIGVVTAKTCFVHIAGDDIPGKFLNRKHPPMADSPFLMFTMTDRFAELYAITPAIGDVFNLLKPADNIRTLFGLFFDILKAYKPEVHEELAQFMKEVIALVEE